MTSESKKEIIQEFTEKYGTDGFGSITVDPYGKKEWIFHFYTWDGYVFDIVEKRIEKRRAQ